MGNKTSTVRELRTESDSANSTLKENIAWSRDGVDPFRYYRSIRKLGVGSMGDVSCVERILGTIGGSAYNPTEVTNCGCFTMVRTRYKEDIGNDNNSSTPEVELKKYAMKSIIIDRVSKRFLEELQNEIAILRDLDHPNIVKPYEIFNYRQQIYVLMELCSGGDLWSRTPYSEQDAAAVMGKILSAIAYMHKAGIIHRDLKLENIMFENKSPGAEIKVLDFGLSKKFAPGEKMTRGVGTIYTMAPQVMQNVYTSQADLWSVGVIAYILLSNKKPFEGRTRQRVVNQIMRCDYKFDSRIWWRKSEEAKSFISELIVLDPKKRLTAVKALEHEWLKKRHNLLDRQPSMDVMATVGEKLVQHSSSNALKQIGLMIIAHKSSTADILELRSAFDQYDKDNDGVITYAEFKMTLQKSGLSEEDIKASFDAMDTTGDGDVHYTEFIAATLETLGNVEENKLAEAFDRLDSDDSGFITKENLRELLGKDFSSDEVNATFAEVDVNKDGKISYEEFKTLFHAKKIKSYDKEVLARELSPDSDDEDLIAAYVPGGMHDNF